MRSVSNNVRHIRAEIMTTLAIVAERSANVAPNESKKLRKLICELDKHRASSRKWTSRVRRAREILALIARRSSAVGARLGLGSPEKASIMGQVDEASEDTASARVDCEPVQTKACQPDLPTLSGELDCFSAAIDAVQVELQRGPRAGTKFYVALEAQLTRVRSEAPETVRFTKAVRHLVMMLTGVGIKVPKPIMARYSPKVSRSPTRAVAGRSNLAIRPKTSPGPGTRASAMPPRSNPVSVVQGDSSRCTREQMTAENGSRPEQAARRSKLRRLRGRGSSLAQREVSLADFERFAKWVGGVVEIRRGQFGGPRPIVRRFRSVHEIAPRAITVPTPRVYTGHTRVPGSHRSDRW
jgi:hypothetical protein